MPILCFIVAFWALLCGAASADSIYVPLSFFGFNLASQSDPRPVYISQTKHLGGSWNNIASCRPTRPTDPGDSCYSWTTLDTYLAFAQTNSYKIEYVLGFAPTWSNGSQTTQYPPTDLTDYTNWVTAYLTRYANKIDAVEVWNEVSDPTSITGYAGTLPDLLTMETSLCAVSHAISPKTKVLSPSTYYGNGLTYHAKYFAAGGGQCVDGFAWHNYPLNSAMASNLEQWDNTTRFYQALLAQYGRAGKPIYITEGGYSNAVSDSVAMGALDPLFMACFATVNMPYAWDRPAGGNTSLDYWLGSANPTALNGRGMGYKAMQSWLAGATITQCPTRVGGATWTRFVEDTSLSFHIAEQDVASQTVGTNISFSTLLRANQRSQAALEIYDGQNYTIAIFDIVSGTVVNSGGLTAAIVNLGGGLFRASVGFPMAATDTPKFYIGPATGGGSYYTGTAGVGVDFADSRVTINGVAGAFSTGITAVSGTASTPPSSPLYGSNQVRNPNGTGASAGIISGGTVTGTLPTYWTSNTTDGGFGVVTQVVGSCTNGTTPGVSIRLYTPTTVQAGASGSTSIGFEPNSGIVTATLGQQMNVGVTVSLVGGSMNNLGGQMAFTEQPSGTATMGSTTAPVVPIATPVYWNWKQNIAVAGTTYVQPKFGISYTVGNAFDATFCLSGATADIGSLWTATITRPGSYQGLIAWDSNGGPTQFAVPGQYVYQRDAVNSASAVLANSSVLGKAPQLFENQAWKGWTP